MKKNLRKFLLITALFFVPMISSAAPSAWSGWYPAGQVYTYSDGSFFISLLPSSAHPNPAGCTAASWIRVMPDQLNAKEIYQMAMTAQAAGLRLNAYISGIDCAGNYPRIHHLRSVK